MADTARLAILTVVLILVVVICWPLAGLGAPDAPLISQHSQPAVRVPAKMVAIVDDGKTFHDSKCAYIHGRPRMVTAEQAAQMGYSPCTRCMREALAKR